MTRWAALLRAINAGVRLPMADLRAFLAARDMRDVKTLLASGNAVFDADEDDAAVLEATLSAALRDTLGVDTSWFLRSHADLASIVAANPYPDAAADHPNHLIVHFCREAVDAATIARVHEIHDGPERIHAIGRELYVDYADSIGESKLPQAMSRARLTKDATARNWNTVTKLVALTARSPAG